MFIASDLNNIFFRCFQCASIVFIYFATICNGSVIKEAELSPIELDEILNGTFAIKTFNGTWISDIAFLYQNDAGDIVKYNLETKQPSIFLEASVLENYPGYTIDVSKDEAYVLIRYNVTSVFRHSTTAFYTIYDIANKKYYDIAQLRPIQLVTFAPEGHGLVYVYLNNIYYLDDFSVDVDHPIQVTSIGTRGIIYCGVPDWVYEEEVLGSGSALWFSPKGTHIAYATFHDENVYDFTFTLYGQPGTLANQYPLPARIKYPKVGTPNPVVVVYVYDIAANTTVEFQLPSKISNKEPNDYVLFDLTWISNTEVALISTNRVQNESIIIRCDATGPCLEEESYQEDKGWLEPIIPRYSKDGRKRLEIVPQVVDNDKFSHLLLTNLDTQDKVWLTTGRIMVLEIYGWDQDSDLIYFSATVPNAPQQQHVYSVSSYGILQCLTCDIIVDGQQCTYAVASFSTNFSYYAKTCGGPNPYYILLENSRNVNDVILWEDNADLKEKLSLKLRPQVKDLLVPIENTAFSARVRLLLPPSLDENSDKKYPMIVNVYGGPNNNQISDVFSVKFQDYIVTNREYIYAFIDGRGSGREGWNKMFEMYRNFATVEIDDQITITKYLQDNFSYIDANRTGIWGWSYGGFASSWVLAKDKDHLFNFALAVAPVSNFIYYDTIYTERYMGLPTPEDNEVGYNNTDLSNQAESFRGRRYFIIHGNADDNVHYQNSMLLVKALELADIEFRQQSYPDENHSLGGVSTHLYHTLDHYWARCFGIEGSPVTSWNNLKQP